MAESHRDTTGHNILTLRLKVNKITQEATNLMTGTGSVLKT